MALYKITIVDSFNSNEDSSPDEVREAIHRGLEEYGIDWLGSCGLIEGRESIEVDRID